LSDYQGRFARFVRQEIAWRKSNPNTDNPIPWFVSDLMDRLEAQNLLKAPIES
jgi:hypothetical protein